MKFGKSDFFNEAETEEVYRNRCIAKETEIKTLYPEKYNEELDSNMIQRLVRSEIRTENLEKLVDNKLDGKDTFDKLVKERKNLDSLNDQLRLTLSQRVGRTENVTVKVDKDFKDVLARNLSNYLSEKEATK